MKGTIKDPPPIPRGTEIKPIIIPDIFFTKFDIFFGLSTNFSLKKIKKSPTIKAKIEKNKTSAAVFKFTAINVPEITPNRKMSSHLSFKNGYQVFFILIQQLCEF